MEEQAQKEEQEAHQIETKLLEAQRAEEQKEVAEQKGQEAAQKIGDISIH